MPKVDEPGRASRVLGELRRGWRYRGARVTDEETVPCPACSGTGKSSRGTSCFPCQGRGKVPGDPGAMSAPRAAALDALTERGVVTAAPAQADATTGNSFGALWSPDPSTERYTPRGVLDLVLDVFGGGIDLDPASCVLAQEEVQASVWYGPGSPFGTDGLVEPWGGRVYLNPPGGNVPNEYKDMGTTSSAALWWSKLASEWQTGEVDQAVFMGFTLEVLRSCQALDCLQPLDFPLCFPKSRIAHDTPNRPRAKGKKQGALIDPTKPAGVRIPQESPTHAQVLVYLPAVNKAERKVTTTHTASMRDFRAAMARAGAEFERVFSALGRCRL